MDSQLTDDMICQVSFNGSLKECAELLGKLSYVYEQGERIVHLELRITKTSVLSAPPPGPETGLPCL